MSVQEKMELRTLDELRKLVEYNNRCDGTVPREYRTLEELDVARDFARWLKKQTGITLRDLRSNPNDPPDCLASQGRETVGIEITELVDAEVRRARVRLYQQVMSSRSDGLGEQQWYDPAHILAELTYKTSLCHDQQRFLRLLRKSIQEKDKKLAGCAQRMPVYVVIFSRDLWLEEEIVSRFLQGTVFRAANIAGAWFRGDYYNGEYPILELPMDHAKP